MRRLAQLALLALLPGALACPPGPAPDDAGPDDAGPDDAGVDDEFLPILDDRADFESLANAEGRVKYLIPVAGAEPRAPLFDQCAFQDTERYPYHLPFLNAQPGGDDIDFNDYVALVLQRASRAWWGGDLMWQAELAHPLSGNPGVLLHTLYTEDSPGNRLVADDVRAIFTALSACAPAFAGTFAFLPSSNEQRQTAQLVQAELAAEGIALLLQ